LACTNLFFPSRFWTICTNFDTCCERNIATSGKKYIGLVHIYILSPKLLQWIFFKSLRYLYEVVRTNILPIFGLFAFFDRNFGICGAN